MNPEPQCEHQHLVAGEGLVMVCNDCGGRVTLINLWIREDDRRIQSDLDFCSKPPTVSEILTFVISSYIS